ncbi:MAG TPA: polysaccharide pyruvyl transferase CsaB, partial [Clostridiales bacterium]|nr:polysaccharide pyruvyl transferase CsaB [Clostridiales bacterium]
VDKPLIGFALRGWQKNERFKQVICKAADSLVRQYGANIVFIPFHYGEDMRILEEIEKEMENEAIFVKNRYDVQTLLGIVGNLDLLIGVRLHSLIFAAIMNTPMIAVSYDPKIDSFMKSLGLEVFCSIDDLEVDRLLEAVEQKWDCYKQEKEMLSTRVQALQKRVHMNEVLLTQLLGQGEDAHER